LWGSRAEIKPGSHKTWLMPLVTWMAPGLIALAILGGILIWYCRDHPYFHVAAIRVYGAERVSQQELVQLAGIQPGMSLWRIDVDQVRRRLLQHPWIRDALVRRLYPNEVEVIVYERKPSAILEGGSGYVIDGAGYVLRPVGGKDWSGLPRLVTRLSGALTPGEQLRDPAVVAGLQMLDQAQDSPFFRNTVISAIAMTNPERFVLQTHRGKLVVGSSIAAVEDKLALLPTIDAALRSSAQQVEQIDVSIAHQIVVKTSTRMTHGVGRLQKRGSGSGQEQ
jgi:cell division protein FtsQ